MKRSNRLLALAVTALPLALAIPARASGVSEAITAMGTFETAVEAGAGACIAVAVVFALIKLGKRLLNRAG